MHVKRTTVVAAALALVAAACGGSGGDTTTTAAPETTTTTVAETTTTAAPETTATTVAETTTTTEAEAMAPTLTVAESDLGTILVDGEGRSLYGFIPDEQTDPTCYDACADNWPPLEASDLTAGDGVDSSLIGSVERTDGTVQATYNDWPLYYFAADLEPGDVEGQGIQDVWYVLDPDGSMIQS